MRTGLSNVTAEGLAAHKAELEKLRNDPNHKVKLPQRIKGPGDYLYDAILKWVGEGPARKCNCKDRIAKMNAWGSAGCREHLEEIVAWLYEEAKKRGWWAKAVAAPGSDYLIRWLVKGAIKQAETYGKA